MRTAFILTLLGGTALAGPAWSAVIDVAQGQSIQAAIGRATAGDTIRVQPGEYSAFQITKSNIRVESAVRGGAHIVATGANQPAIGSYGQNNVTVTGFRLTSRNGDGVKIGGSPGNMVDGIEFTDNTTEWAKLDGLKFFQMENSTVSGNTVKMAGGGGTAGSAGNPNGDGGIDCVTCRNSTISSNTVENTNGWAALMLKTASDGNRIENNTLNNSDPKGVGMTVGGVSGGRAAQATGTVGNDGGREARNNLVRNNAIRSAGCGFYFSNATNNRMEGNQVQDAGCAKTQGSNNEKADVSAQGSGRTGTGATFASTASVESVDPKTFEDAIKKAGAAGYSVAEIRQGFRENGWTVHESAIVGIIAGTMTGQQAVDQGLIAAGTTTDGSQSSGGSYSGGGGYSGGDSGMDIERLPGMACGGGQAAAAAMGAAGAIAGWFNGGKATAGLQMAQQIQLYTANACLFAQLQAQLQMVWAQLENLRSIDLNTVNGWISGIYRVRGLLGNVDATVYNVNAISRKMQEMYPDTFGGKSTQEVIDQTIIWNDSAKKATDESWRIQAQIVENQTANVQNTNRHLNALQHAPGMLAAQQATGNLIASLIEKASDMEAASIAHYRVMEHKLLKEQAAEEQDEELHRRAMEDWGKVDSVYVPQPF